jgi:methylated-DNA-[protein]-cysteine S-methyltransferase
MSELERALRASVPAAGGPPPLAPQRLADAGVLDVAYAVEETPVGTLLLAATARGVVRIAYVDGGPEAALQALAAEISPRVLRAPSRTDPLRRQLDEYFAGQRRVFDIALDWRLTRAAFTRRVLRATAAIPYGATSSYKRVAGEAGSPRAFRAAGNALGSNPLPIVVPCHRVLASGGGLGGYTGGLERKRALLALERGGAG